MRDGIYAFRYEALGRVSRGSLTLKADRANGGDTRVLLEGQVSQAANHVTASLDVQSVGELKASQVDHGLLAFPINLSGSGSDTHFDVIGVGPRGVIVAIAGEWTSPLAKRIE